MGKSRYLIVAVCIALFVLMGLPAGIAQEHGIKEYEAPRVVGDPPTIDGVYEEAEWADVPWAEGYFGLNNQGSNGDNQGQPVDIDYRWKATWDSDYLYIVIEAPMPSLPLNGVIGGEIVDTVVEGDDQIFTFDIGLGTDIEFFLEPDWQDGDGFNSDPPDFTDPGGDETDGYQFVWFPLENDLDFTPANEGLRNADAPDGPPWFFTGGNYDSGFVGGTWDPTFNADEAAAVDALPFVAGAFLNITDGDEVYATPTMEVAMAFSQFNPNFGIPEASSDGETNLWVQADDNGEFVNPGDEWLINQAGYTDPERAAGGLTLITWNNVIGGAFASHPRGILRFVADTTVNDWMLK